MMDLRESFSDPERRKVLYPALDSLLRYDKHSHVPHTSQQAIQANGHVTGQIVSSALARVRGNNDAHILPIMFEWEKTALPPDEKEARCTIRQLHRDWSGEGADERKAFYEPVIGDVVKEFTPCPRKANVNVLVPGAGVGRLAFELCQLGYTVQGNGISYQQLITQSWIMNDIDPGKNFDLFPFVLDYSNAIGGGPQLNKAKIPDTNPANVLGEDAADRMQMKVVDFEDLYEDEDYKGMFSAVVTVNFIDTAPNLIRCIDTIHYCLQDGGLWVNLGLLRQKPGSKEPGAFEMTHEDLLVLVERSGFRVKEADKKTYEMEHGLMPESMLQCVYQISHWTASKRFSNNS